MFSVPEPAKVAEINLFSEMGDEVIIVVTNKDESSPCWVKITRSGLGAPEELVAQDFIMPGESRYFALKGVFKYVVYANREVSVGHVTIIKG